MRRGSTVESDPLSAPQPNRGVEEVDVDLPEFVRFVRRHALLIVGWALGAGLVVALALFLLVPPTYEASATLVVAPPQFRSELKPPPLSVQGYQRLLESDTVVAKTTDALIEQAVLGKDTSLQVGQRLESRIFVSRRAEETALAPIIEVAATASESDVAAAITNTWSAVFLDHVDQLVQGAIGPAYEFISSEFEEARNDLEKLEQREGDLASEYQRRIDDLQSSWNRRLVGHKNETEDLLAGYQAATRKRMEEFAADLYESLPRPDDPGPPAESQARLRVQLDQIVSLRTQLAQTPQLLTLEKAISDDALWEAILGREGTPAEFQERMLSGLRTQEVNPVYADLALKLSNVELALDPRAGGPRTEIWSLAGEMETIQRQRSAGLANLVSERDQQREELERGKRRKVEELRGERAMVLGQVRRDIERRKSLVKTLGEEYQEVQMARSEQNLPDVRLASPAVPPNDPEPRRAPLKILLAMILGGLCGVVAGWIRTLGEQQPPGAPPQGSWGRTESRR